MIHSPSLFLFTVVAFSLMAGFVDATAKNPCDLDHDCGVSAAADTCNYGSVCAGNSTDISSKFGFCSFRDRRLGCGGRCQASLNATSGTYNIGNASCPLSTTCGTAVSESFDTCGIAPTQWAPYQCPCSAASIDTQCSSRSCVDNRCALAGLGFMPWGFVCSGDSDCRSGACEGGRCAGVVNGETCTSLSNNGFCDKGLVCAGIVDARTCKPYIEIGGACSLATGSTPCVPYGVCDTVTSLCVYRYAASTASTCSTSKDCHIGSGCVSSACATPACSSSLGSFSCSPGQTCGCSSTSPVCSIGTAITQTCADAVNAYERCVFENTEMGPMISPSNAGGGNFAPGVAPNFIPTPSQCYTQFKAVHCSATCDGLRDSVFIEGPDDRGMSFPDYNLIDCAVGKFTAYSDAQTQWCSRSYCPSTTRPSVDESDSSTGDDGDDDDTSNAMLSGRGAFDRSTFVLVAPVAVMMFVMWLRV